LPIKSISLKRKKEDSKLVDQLQAKIKNLETKVEDLENKLKHAKNINNVLNRKCKKLKKQ